MKSTVLLFLFVLLGFESAMATRVDNIPAIGTHYRLFTVEKNENPGNILVLYTKLDGNCYIQTESRLPVFDMYWLMNRSSYKPTHALIKKGVRERLQVVPSNSQAFYVRVNDLKEVNSDLTDPRLIIEADKVNGTCKVRSWLTLGPSNKYAKIQLSSIYSEAVKTVVPPFRKLVSVTLIGVDVNTGAKVSRKYLAK
jgi:hypothetical protein